HKLAETADHSRGAQFRGQLSHSIDAILQGQYSRVGSHQRLHGPGRLRHLPGLDADDYQIDFTNIIEIVRGPGRINHEVSGQTVTLQPLSLDRPQVFAAGDKRTLCARLCQPAAEVSTHSAGAIDSYSHRPSETF